ncbi:hypothetical protein pdul_cds_976 [Pandoravirus dulcis]|uniref:Uncharacterized protein n=1 Tax=Pandoravirus dulcis TaxID=1349409 RepID=S4VZF2_9VIRU|nr:hypothetical protein pdul_cds_976 [Pandoravirus dulcis]AGO83234.2 hypothetical protein pdul_cds_976 [Pandoravirus dulcis]
MGQSNATMKKGYCSVPQDVMAAYGITDAEYEAKARAVVARIRAMPDGYASAEDRAAAINAILTGTGDEAMLARVRAALDRWDRDRAATGHPFKSKVA